MAEDRKPVEIADEDLQMHGGDGTVSSLDALVVINQLSALGKDATSLNPSRTYSVAEDEGRTMLNPSRTYKG